MSQAELQPFVDAAKSQGAADEFLASLLTRRGWAPAEIYNALGSWWERATGIPVPMRRTAAEGARDAFLYLLAFSTLATWTSALGSLWFQLIEWWLPDQVIGPRYYDFRATVTWQMASILVALPVYLFVMRVILRETQSGAERIDSAVRKWLTYIALLLTAAGLVCDLVCFVSFFLRGELTPRFVLKCLTVLLICGSIFWYYFGFLKGRTRSREFAGLALALAAVGLCFGFGLAGTPNRQRAIEADSRRVQDLRALAGVLHDIPALPRSLPELKNSRPQLQITDPQTGTLYDYLPAGGRNYQLCASFATAGDPANRPYPSAFWSHPQGRACFAMDASAPVPW
jgi:hypothetical protein